MCLYWVHPQQLAETDSQSPEEPQIDSLWEDMASHRIGDVHGCDDDLHLHLLASVSGESVAFDLDDDEPTASED